MHSDHAQAARARAAGWKTPFVEPEPPLFIDVITGPMSRNPNDPPEQTHRINYNSDRARGWLKGHMKWALNTGRTVHLAAVL